MKNHNPTAVSALLSVVFLAGCGTVSQDITSLKDRTTQRINEETQANAQPVPIVSRTQSAWILGEAVPVVAAPPAVLSRRITYNPRQQVTLTDVAAYVSQALGLSIDTSEVLSTTTQSTGGIPNTPPSFPTPTVPSLSGAPSMPPVMGPGAGMMPGSNAQQGQQGAARYFPVDYDGKLAGLLDIVASKAGVWWKYVEGRGILFYRSETKTFYLPALPNKSKGSGSINTNSTASNANGAGGGSSGSSSGSSGGLTSTEFAVDIWGDLEKTAQTVGAGARVAVNPSVGSVTVTGTPTQVRYVEDWVKSLTDNLSQQISITVDIYSVRVNAEDNYSWDPSVVFKSAAGKWGMNLSGPQAPAIVSGTNPLNLTASILNGTTSGSTFALNALSTLGDVVQVMHQSVVTLNGRPAPLQMAEVEGYLAASTPSASVAVGATPLPPTLTPGTLTTGFTANFIPKIANGKIFLAMDLTSSTNHGFGTIGSGGALIQTPNYSQNTFQQSAMLTPGASLLLTGVQQHTGKSNRNGVGSPNVHILGGGRGESTGKQLTAIVITAKVL
ncbi:hypothetical protein CBP36_21280 (plasmid) [Acidovorax carolinensis]|uniref:Secretin N-terminal domain-containing protein n=1 Tax=Acidovorax carolinensis TaxID=553814 RepID=A0A240UKD0_9BURK|nr:secretin N-terminal domain-containing protein [Acidovorax carolinensis]ART61502.1 hypothetical protein CBP36_21280 [Acidovorax carolinensis]